jgi:PAS domain S-box-containing protein
MAPIKGIGRSLTWLVLVGILPIIAFSGGMAWLFIDHQKAAVEAELSSTARALGVAIDRELESQLTAMRILATGRSLDGNDVSNFADRARRVMAEHPPWLDVVLVDPHSHIIIEGALPRPDPAPTSSAPGAVDDVVRTGKPVIVGAFARGKIIDRPLIMLMVPVLRGGEVRLVMTCVVDPAAISDIFTAQRLPPAWTGAVVDAGMRLAGRSRDPGKYVGRPATPSLAARIAAADSGMFEAVNQEGDKVYTVFSRSGVTGWSVVIGIPAADIDGPIARTVAVVTGAGAALIVLALGLASLVGRTIVARRRAWEGALKDSEERYRLLIEGVRDHAIFHVSVDGLVETWNTAAGHIKGYKAQDIIGRHISCFYPPEDVAAGRPGQALAMARRDGRCEENGWRMRRDGSRFWANVVFSALYDDAGVLRGFAKITRDLTDRRRLEEERQRLVMAIEQSPVSVVITAPDGMIEYVNPAFTRVTGYSLDEAVGQNPRILKSGETSFAEYRAMWDDLAAGKDWAGLFHNKRKDGALYWERAQISPVIDNEGRIANYIAIKEDITARIDAEQAIHRLNRQLKDILAAASEVAVVATDQDGIVTLFNRGAERMLGYDSQDVVCKQSPLLFHAEDEVRARGLELTAELGMPVEGVRVLVEKAERDGHELREWTYVRRDGRRLTVSLAVTPVRSEDGRITGYLGVAQDITDRKKAEVRLARESARYQSLLKTASDGIHILDMDGNLIEASESFRLMLGYRPEQMASLRVTDWDAVMTDDDFKSRLIDLVSSSLIFESRHRRVDGTVLDVEINCHGVEFEGQTYLYASSRDITERKRLSERLRQSEERFRLLFNSGNDFIWLHRADPATGVPVGHFIEVNDVACHRLGYSRDEMLAMGPADIDDPSTPTVDNKVLSLATNDWAVFERLHVTKGGRRIPMEINARKIVYQGETLILSICRDITERRALEEELRRSNAELEAFAYVASHDLRQPLRIVNSYLQLVETGLKDVLGDETRQFIAFARDGAKRMDHLIVDLLEYSRIGRHAGPFQPVALAGAVAEALDNLKIAVAEAKAGIAVSSDLPTVDGNLLDLTRLFQNLVGNAVKYHAPDRTPRISIACQRASDQWVVSVQDNGIGIPADQTDRVFGVFQRLHTSARYEGTGIGLAVCRKIVEHHGGRIWVDSVEGEGSAFRFTLPVTRGLP